ncbi:hypothetical protein [Hymenobacter guriensis]|uniref:Uncharacterized protein n=1 Tax=Hymenobacter guriensis TaxID=2793065 RepID=A0ABS0L8N3_9BACT|nr:hypothetical protein [Hymenobacter guriensis]MBG8556290.1 hypothetical protein [Hymenobacter guriensis]
MDSNAKFFIGVHVEEPTADPLSFLFQQDLLGVHTYAVRAPRRLLETMGPSAFAEHLTDYYLQQYPAEAERVGKPVLLQAVVRAMQQG